MTFTQKNLVIPMGGQYQFTFRPSTTAITTGRMTITTAQPNVQVTRTASKTNGNYAYYDSGADALDGISYWAVGVDFEVQ